MYEIHNDPAPSLKGVAKYPFSKLEIGQCFYFEQSKKNSVYAAASRKGKELGRKFTVIRNAETGAYGVWRVK